jgi:hypothetical protein
MMNANQTVTIRRTTETLPRRTNMTVLKFESFDPSTTAIGRRGE